MGLLRIGAVAAHFGRDLDRCVARILGMLEDARRAGVGMLVLPDAALGGYLADLQSPDPDALPPALPRDCDQLKQIAAAAGEIVVCVGYSEAAGDQIFNSAICLSGDGVLGHHRKVHQPPGETFVYAAGHEFHAFDTPVGRVGMLIDFDKTFPESSRTLCLDRAEVLAFLSAWPASVTNRSARLVSDRQTRLFDLYDCARAAENQVVVASANQTGVMGGLRFIGQAKVVGPGGEVLARTYARSGMAVAEIDLGVEITTSRRVLHHLAQRKPASYTP